MIILTGSDLLQITDNVGHASLVTKEGSQVGLLGGVILGESPHCFQFLYKYFILFIYYIFLIKFKKKYTPLPLW
jgi:hypothetical protein